MPPAPIVPGVEYPWYSGGSVSLFYTVHDAAGLPYTIRAEQTGTDQLRITFIRSPQPDFVRTVRLDVGNEVLVTPAQSQIFGVTFNELRRRVQVQIIPGR